MLSSWGICARMNLKPVPKKKGLFGVSFICSILHACSLAHDVLPHIWNSNLLKPILTCSIVTYNNNCSNYESILSGKDSIVRYLQCQGVSSSFICRFIQMSFYFKVINVLVVYSYPQLHKKSLFLKLLPLTPSFSARGSMTGNSRLHEIVFCPAYPIIFARP